MNYFCENLWKFIRYFYHSDGMWYKYKHTQWSGDTEEMLGQKLFCRIYLGILFSLSHGIPISAFIATKAAAVNSACGIWADMVFLSTG